MNPENLNADDCTLEKVGTYPLSLKEETIATLYGIELCCDETMEDREALVNLITSRKWKPETLREAVADSFPHISANMPSNLGLAIDRCAFRKTDLYFIKDFVNYGKGPIIKKKQIVSSLEEEEKKEERVFSVDWVGAFSLKLHQIDLEYFQSIECPRYMELFSFINSQEWKPWSLRDALLEQFPDICSNLTMGMARTIDSLAFHNAKRFSRTEGFYWCEAYNFPHEDEELYDNTVAIWVGAFTFQKVDPDTYYDMLNPPHSYD